VLPNKVAIVAGVAGPLLLAGLPATAMAADTPHCGFRRKHGLRRKRGRRRHRVCPAGRASQWRGQ
jgi:hypothetical protein